MNVIGKLFCLFAPGTVHRQYVLAVLWPSTVVLLAVSILQATELAHGTLWGMISTVIRDRSCLN